VRLDLETGEVSSFYSSVFGGAERSDVFYVPSPYDPDLIYAVNVGDRDDISLLRANWDSFTIVRTMRYVGRVSNLVVQDGGAHLYATMEAAAQNGSTLEVTILNFPNGSASAAESISLEAPAFDLVGSRGDGGLILNSRNVVGNGGDSHGNIQVLSEQTGEELIEIDLAGEFQRGGRSVLVSGDGTRIIAWTAGSVRDEGRLHIIALPQRAGAWSETHGVGIAADVEDVTVAGGWAHDLIDSRLLTSSNATITLDGGDGNDTISGGASAETIVGGNDRDLLFAGSQEDTLLSGPGDDEFRGHAVTESIAESYFGLRRPQFGVSFATQVYLSNTSALAANAVVTSAVDATLDAWVDFNHDGDFDDAGEQIAQGESLYAGQNLIAFSIPVDSATGTTPFRFVMTPSAKFSASVEPVVEERSILLVDTETSKRRVLALPELPGNYTISEADEELFLRLDERVIGTVPTAAVSELFVRGSRLNDRLTLEQFPAGLKNHVTVKGGAGNDWISAESAGISIRLEGGSGGDTLLGGPFSDTLAGGVGNDQLTGGSGRDVLLGSKGWDTLDGGRGNDVVKGQASADTLTGGPGNDKLIGSGSYDVVIETADSDFLVLRKALYGLGNDRLGSIEEVRLTGGDRNNTMDATAFRGNVILIGAAGNDTLNGGIGDDVIDAGAGNDVVSGGSGRNELRGGDGDDELVDGIGDDVIDAGPGDDTLTVGAGRNEIRGGAGSDRLITQLDGHFSLTKSRLTQTNGSGETSIPDFDIEVMEFSGGPGDDLLDASAYGSSVTLFGAGGDDTLIGTRYADELYGGDGSDSLTGANGDNLLDGGSGNDVLNGGWDHDRINGQAGNDAIFGNRGHDELTGGSGNDSLFGGWGDDLLDGGSGNDSILGETGEDQLDGRDGDDILDGGDGRDQLTGGGGDDVLNGGNGHDQLDGGDGDDSLSGGGGVDSLNGDTGDDWLDGGNGDDLIAGEGGNDTVRGGGGEDEITGGDGDDLLSEILSGQFELTPDGSRHRLYDSRWTVNLPALDVERGELIGGPGHDRLDAEEFDGPVTLRGNDGDDVLIGSQLDDVLIGGNGDDAMESGPGNDYLDGGDGSDVFLGGDGNDTIMGGAGDDLIDGDVFDNRRIGNANSNDLIDGGEGRDTLWGGPGNDTLTGGLDDDLLIGRQGNDSLMGGSGVDTLDGSTGRRSDSGDVFDDPSQIDERYSINFEDVFTTRALEILTSFL
jgi:Ca2+-binding RTX toxin-like protein